MDESSTTEKAKLFSKPSPVSFINSATAPAGLESDVVIVFDSTSSFVPSSKKTKTIIDDALRFLLAELVNAGFTFSVRSSKPGAVFIFVRASDKVIAIADYQSKVRDWLYGVRPTAPSPSEELDSEFSVAERLRLVYARLTLSAKDHGLGITPGQGDWIVVKSIFAPHDPEFNVAWINRWSRRWQLDDAELELIRGSFGEEIGMYFAFLQFYFKQLIFPMVLGLAAYFFLPDFSPIFAVVNCIWCCVFVESWKKREVELAVKWGVKDSAQLQHLRPTFRGDSEREDPITGILVQYYPSWKRVAKQFTAIPVAFVAGVALVILQGLVFIIEIFLAEIYDGPGKQYLVFLPTALLATLVPTFTKFYGMIATGMTDWENHASEHTYATSMTQKMFVLNFLTSYMGLFLSSYVYLPFGHLIAPNMELIAINMRYFIGEKASAKAFTLNTLRLKQQYIYFIATAQLINFFVETCLPFIQRKIFSEAKKLQGKVTGTQVTGIVDAKSEAAFLSRVRAEAEYPDYEVAEDYREMVVQFGYLSLFATVWPLAPAFSFVNNWVELRGDAVKICLDTKRPIPAKADSIGPWLDNLSFLTWLGSLTTASLVAMYRTTNGDSNSLVSTRPWVLFATVLLSEHVYLVVRYLVSLMFASFDSDILQKDKKQKYISRRSIMAEQDEKVHVEDVEHEMMRVTEDERDDWRKQINEAINLLDLTLLNDDKKKE
ncbi:calcium-activated chloride channel-domain-containing protein [Lipomyces arxii]|uniref:calcium-activated chloride channel-domain-containing protein n=1 Tax=Lipomyces arxii TaxID=56418 RepID=UPI0034CD1407